MDSALQGIRQELAGRRSGRDGAGGGEQHGVAECKRVRGERPVEQSGETQRIADALAIGRDSGTRSQGRSRFDLRVGIGERKDDLPGADSVGCNQVRRACRADHCVRRRKDALETLAVTMQLHETSHRLKTHVGSEQTLDAVRLQQARNPEPRGPEPNNPQSPVAQYFDKACPDAYSWSGDDANSVVACAGEDYIIVFCP